MFFKLTKHIQHVFLFISSHNALCSLTNFLLHCVKRKLLLIKLQNFYFFTDTNTFISIKRIRKVRKHSQCTPNCRYWPSVAKQKLLSDKHVSLFRVFMTLKCLVKPVARDFQTHPLLTSDQNYNKTEWRWICFGSTLNARFFWVKCDLTLVTFVYSET